MQKLNTFIKMMELLVISALLLTGCTYGPYVPADPDDKNTASRTFAIEDEYPYPGKGNVWISDKEVGKSDDAYIYITNNGGHIKDHTARDVKVTLVDETKPGTLDLGTYNIESNGYIKLNGRSYPDNARVHILVEGYIRKNKNHEDFVTVRSNSFNIGNPNSGIQSVTVSPSNPTIQIGQSQIFTAKAKMANGVEVDITQSAVWKSANINIAEMAGNVARGKAQGTVEIAAEYEGKSGKSTLTVIAPTLEKITITPNKRALQVGQNQSYLAIATYKDGSTADITQLATWTSSNTGVVELSGNTARAVGAGNSDITVSFGGKTATINLTVVPPSQAGVDGSKLIWEKEIIVPRN